MSPIVGKVVLVGIPLLLSLAWSAFWIVKLLKAAGKARRQAPRGSGVPDDAHRQ